MKNNKTNKTFIIMKKELLIYFKSPLAYAVAAVFTAVCGFLFYSIVKDFSIQSLKLIMLQREAPSVNLHEVIFRPSFHNMTVITLILTPILTMNLVAGEYRNGTMEMLLTSPVKISEIVLGKFLGTLSLFAVLLLFTLPMPIMLGFYKNIDWLTQISGYTGMLLAGAAFISAGMFTSSVTKNQLTAGLLCIGMLLMLWMAGFLVSAFDNNLAVSLLSYISIYNHTEDFHKGLITVNDIIYFSSFIFLMLFMTHKVIETGNTV